MQFFVVLSKQQHLGTGSYVVSVLPQYQKAGVTLGDFFSKGVAQLNLFDQNAPRASSEALMSLMDKLNQQGRGTIFFAGQGIQQLWQMKREMLSPCYTTRLSDVPTARA